MVSHAHSCCILLRVTSAGCAWIAGRTTGAQATQRPGACSRRCYPGLCLPARSPSRCQAAWTCFRRLRIRSPTAAPTSCAIQLHLLTRDVAVLGIPRLHLAVHARCEVAPHRHAAVVLLAELAQHHRLAELQRILKVRPQLQRVAGTALTVRRSFQAAAVVSGTTQPAHSEPQGRQVSPATLQERLDLPNWLHSLLNVWPQKSLLVGFQKACL